MNVSPVNFGATQLQIGGVTLTLPAGSLVGTGGSYANPSWLTSIAWSKLTNKPTTYSGYGITDVQPLSGNLTAFSGAGNGANKFPYFTGSSSMALADLSSAGRSLIDDPDAPTMRATLGLAIGTNVQAFHANLSALSSLTPTANKLPYFNGVSTAALTDLSAAARSLLDDTDAATMRATLGAASSGTTLTPGSGLTGGGDLSTNRSISLSFAGLPTYEASGQTPTPDDLLAVYDASAGVHRKMPIATFGLSSGTNEWTGTNSWAGSSSWTSETETPIFLGAGGNNALHVRCNQQADAAALFLEAGEDDHALICRDNTNVRNLLMVGANYGVIIGGDEAYSCAIQSILGINAELDFPSTSAGAENDLNTTVGGASPGNPVWLGIPNSSTSTGVLYQAWVSAANTVTVRCINYSAGTKNPPTGVFKSV